MEPRRWLPYRNLQSRSLGIALATARVIAWIGMLLVAAGVAYGIAVAVKGSGLAVPVVGTVIGLIGAMDWSRWPSAGPWRRWLASRKASVGKLNAPDSRPESGVYRRMHWHFGAKLLYDRAAELAKPSGAVCLGLVADRVNDRITVFTLASQCFKLRTQVRCIQSIE